MKLCIVAILAACKREAVPERGPPVVTPPAPAPVAADASPKAEPVDLLHAVPATVAVSSIVADPAYSPFDLVDGEPASDWRARAGDDHPWIAFRLPADVTVDKVRMTAGFDAKGPDGDYFTMNPRIRHVRITRADQLVREADLDIDKRELQDIPIGAPGGDYKIEIVATAPGTKKDWREVVVSELHVIGPAPANKHPDPTMAIGSLDGAHVDPPNDVLMAPLERAVIRGVPKVKMPVPAQLPKGWSKVSWKTSLGSCRLVIEMNGTNFETDDLGDACIAQGAIDRHYSVATQDRWLLLTTSYVRPATDTVPAQIGVMLHVCTTASDGKPMCSWALPLESITHRERDEVDWQIDYKLEPDAITLSRRTGELPEDVRRELGRHRLPRWHYSD